MLDQLLVYIEKAQKNGVFILQESDLLKKCKDTLFNNGTYPEITPLVAANVFIQAVIKGQKAGCYTLEEASVIYNICQELTKPAITQKESVSESKQESVQTPKIIKIEPKVSQFLEDEGEELDRDLSSLSDPVPIKMI